MSVFRRGDMVGERYSAGTWRVWEVFGDRTYGCHCRDGDRILSRVFHERDMEHSGLGRYSWKPAVLGLDLSLASTGYALDVVRSGLFIDMEVGRIRSKLKGAERLIEIRDEVRDLITRADLVVLEGYAYARANQAHQIGELGGVIRVLLKEQSKPNLIVAPKTVKKWATGSGNAGKPEMVDAAWKQLGYLGKSSDEADALWLHHLGTGAFDPQHPSVRLDEFRSAWVQDLDTPDVSI